MAKRSLKEVSDSEIQQAVKRQRVRYSNQAASQQSRALANGELLLQQPVHIPGYVGQPTVSPSPAAPNFSQQAGPSREQGRNTENTPVEARPSTHVDIPVINLIESDDDQHNPPSGQGLHDTDDTLQVAYPDLAHLDHRLPSDVTTGGFHIANDPNRPNSACWPPTLFDPALFPPRQSSEDAARELKAAEDNILRFIVPWNAAHSFPESVNTTEPEAAGDQISTVGVEAQDLGNARVALSLPDADRSNVDASGSHQDPIVVDEEDEGAPAIDPQYPMDGPRVFLGDEDLRGQNAVDQDQADQHEEMVSQQPGHSDNLRRPVSQLPSGNMRDDPDVANATHNHVPNALNGQVVNDPQHMVNGGHSNPETTHTQLPTGSQNNLLHPGESALRAFTLPEGHAAYFPSDKDPDTQVRTITGNFSHPDMAHYLLLKGAQKQWDNQMADVRKIRDDNELPESSRILLEEMKRMDLAALGSGPEKFDRMKIYWRVRARLLPLASETEESLRGLDSKASKQRVKDIMDRTLDKKGYIHRRSWLRYADLPLLKIGDWQVDKPLWDYMTLKDADEPRHGRSRFICFTARLGPFAGGKSLVKDFWKKDGKGSSGFRSSDSSRSPIETSSSDASTHTGDTTQANTLDTSTHGSDERVPPEADQNEESVRVSWTENRQHDSSFGRRGQASGTTQTSSMPNAALPAPAMARFNGLETRPWVYNDPSHNAGQAYRSWQQQQQTHAAPNGASRGLVQPFNAPLTAQRPNANGVSHDNHQAATPDTLAPQGNHRETRMYSSGSARNTTQDYSAQDAISRDRARSSKMQERSAYQSYVTNGSVQHGSVRNAVESNNLPAATMHGNQYIPRRVDGPPVVGRRPRIFIPEDSSNVPGSSMGPPPARRTHGPASSQTLINGSTLSRPSAGRPLQQVPSTFASGSKRKRVPESQTPNQTEGSAPATSYGGDGSSTGPPQKRPRTDTSSGVGLATTQHELDSSRSRSQLRPTSARSQHPSSSLASSPHPSVVQTNASQATPPHLRSQRLAAQLIPSRRPNDWRRPRLENLLGSIVPARLTIAQHYQSIDNAEMEFRSANLAPTTLDPETGDGGSDRVNDELHQHYSEWLGVVVERFNQRVGVTPATRYNFQP
ncbi:MAG: hypothetical protein M1828_003844 [Chrysothrix sp. TS-e1954]|nr:MAG: hypothetical protein M1828_003844 [Chrysothrix sp. TS-e1954]